MACIWRRWPCCNPPWARILWPRWRWRWQRKFWRACQKAPANIFSLIGIVPLVPGGGLYQTMLALVMDDYSAALSTGVQTMLIAGAIALAIAVVAVFFRALPARQK